MGGSLKQRVRSFLDASELLYLRWISSFSVADVRVRGFAIVAVSVLNVSVGAFFYKMVSGDSRSWEAAFFRVYSVLLDAPGSNATEDDEMIGPLIVLNIIYLVGLIVFAVLIGMVGEEVAVQVLKLRNGRQQLDIEDHILILNWNSQGPAVVKQLLRARHRKCIAVLADEDQEKLDAAVAKLGPGREGRNDGGVQVYVREGMPFRSDHLSLVCATEASIIILLYPESAGSVAKAETLKAVTVAALTTLDGFHEQALIVQVPSELSDNEHSVDTVQDLFATRREGDSARCGMHVVRLSEQSIVDRLVAQSSIQPGLIMIYETVLSQGEHVDFEFEAMREAAGKFGDVRKRFPAAITCGFVSSFDGVLHLNPGDADLVMKGDQLVFLRHVDIKHESGSVEAHRNMYDKAEALAQIRLKTRNTAPTTLSRKISVVGWVPEQVGELVAGFSEFSPAGTQVTVVVDRLPDELREYLQRTLARSSARAAAGKRHDNSSGGWGDARLQATMRRQIAQDKTPTVSGSGLPPIDGGSSGTQTDLSRLLSSSATMIKVASVAPMSPAMTAAFVAGVVPSMSVLAQSPLMRLSSVSRVSSFPAIEEDSLMVQLNLDDQSSAPHTGAASSECGASEEVDTGSPNHQTSGSLALVSPEMEISKISKRKLLGQLPRPVGSSSSLLPMGLNADAKRQAHSTSHDGSMSHSSSAQMLGDRLSYGSLTRRLRAKAEQRGIQFTVGNTDFTFKVFQDPFCEEAMRAAGVQEADAVVLGMPSKATYPFSDAQLLSGLFLIQSIAEEADHKVHVVAKVSNANTKKIAKRFFDQLSNSCITFELLVPEKITSAVLTQTAWQPNYMQLVQELLVNSEGMELYIIDPARLGFNVGDRTTFAELTEAGRHLSYTVLGYTKGTGLSEEQVLAPHAQQEIEIESDNKLILLAEEW